MDSHPPYKTFTDTTLQLQIIVLCGSRKYPYHPYRRDLPYDAPCLWIFWNQPPNSPPPPSPHLCHLQNYVWETNAEVPYWWRVSAKISVVLLIGHTAVKICFNQSEALPRFGYWCIISTKFLCLFLRRHFPGKPLVSLWNVGCFLRLSETERFSFPQNNSAMTDLLIYINNTASCLVIFNSEERDVMLEKFWCDILMEQVQEVVDFIYKFTQLIGSKWV